MYGGEDSIKPFALSPPQLFRLLEAGFDRVDEIWFHGLGGLPLLYGVYLYLGGFLVLDSRLFSFPVVFILPKSLSPSF